MAYTETDVPASAPGRVETATYSGPDRRAFGLRRDEGYWRKRAIRRGAIFTT